MWQVPRAQECSARCWELGEQLVHLSGSSEGRGQSRSGDGGRAGEEGRFPAGQWIDGRLALKTRSKSLSCVFIEWDAHQTLKCTV